MKPEIETTTSPPSLLTHYLAKTAKKLSHFQATSANKVSEGLGGDWFNVKMVYSNHTLHSNSSSCLFIKQFSCISTEGFCLNIRCSITLLNS